MFIFGMYEGTYRPTLFTVDRDPNSTLLLVIDELGKMRKATAITTVFTFSDEKTELHFKNWFGLSSIPNVVGTYREEETIW